MKTIISLTAFLLLFSCRPPSPEGATALEASLTSAGTSINCDMISNWERAREFTLSYLQAMPEEYYDFAPAPETLPFAQEFLHLACANYRYAAMIAGSYDCTDQESVFNRPDLQTKEAVIDFVLGSYDTMIERLSEEPDLDETTYLYQWTCSKACLATKGFEHQSHHRGKAAVYLRLKGVSPPGHLLWEKELIMNWATSKDISQEEWMASEAYRSYERKVDQK